MLSDKTINVISLGVFVLWAMSMIYDGYNAEYDPPAAIHGALTIVLGGAVGARLTNKDKRDAS